jgi:hypothetical protein
LYLPPSTIAVHAVEAGARDALQPVLLCEDGFFLVVQHERAAFDRRQVLVGVEAERHHVAELADALAAPRRAERLRRVFDHAQLVGAGDFVEPVHIDRQTRQIHRDDRLGARRNGLFEQIQIDVAGLRIDIREYRRRARFV